MKNQNKQLIPSHIVLVPDGNRRWAREKGVSVLAGHTAGKDNVENFCDWCLEAGVEILTTFVFSSENWNRPEKEAKFFMRMLERAGMNQIKNFGKKDGFLAGGRIRFRVIGERKRLNKNLEKTIEDLEKMTKNSKGLLWNVALSYSGRWDILQAVKKISRDKIPPGKINESLFESYLVTAGLPAPDLLIRTGKERRLSNFLLWQTAYSEIYFCDKYWPEFTKRDFNKILEDYSKRQRRFGR